MRIYRILASAAVLIFFAIPAFSQCSDGLITDADAYVDQHYPSHYFPLDNDSPHPVEVICIWNPLKDNDSPHPVEVICSWNPPNKCWAKRSYIHFSGAELPSCISKATLWLNFSVVFPVWGTRVEVREADWDGGYITWNTQPTLGNLVDSKWISFPGGWTSFDVTETVKRFLDGEIDHLAFVVKLGFEGSLFKILSFTTPCLEITPCIKVKVSGLKSATVCQSEGSSGGCDAYISSSRYAPFGELEVKVSAADPYEVRACYEVDPPPSPPFSADPVDIAYNWVWMTMPACPSYMVLPGFSGAPGDETRTYRVRVDLADLGDRASGEEFEFVIRVWAVPK